MKITVLTDIFHEFTQTKLCSGQYTMMPEEDILIIINAPFSIPKQQNMYNVCTMQVLSVLCMAQI